MTMSERSAPGEWAGGEGLGWFRCVKNKEPLRNHNLTQNNNSARWKFGALLTLATPRSVDLNPRSELRSTQALRFL